MRWPPSVSPWTRTTERPRGSRTVALAARGTPVMRTARRPRTVTSNQPNTAPGGGVKRTRTWRPWMQPDVPASCSTPPSRTFGSGSS